MRLFGEELRRARERVGMSQRQLARASGHTQQWISELEKGEKGSRLKRAHALDFVRALNLEEDDPSATRLLDAAGTVSARDGEQTDLRHLFATDPAFRMVVRALMHAWTGHA